MVKSVMTKQPKEQRCHYLIGPVSSWFMPNSSDIWTQPKNCPGTGNDTDPKVSPDQTHMEFDEANIEEKTSLSYFIYGSIGCFCYGEIYHHDNLQHNCQPQYRHNSLSASARHLVDVKDDNSRVSCVRFLKTLVYPTAIVLTESGSLVIHDCLRGKNLVHIKKSELLNKLIGPSQQQPPDEPTIVHHCNKKAKFNVTQQINSFAWPTKSDLFFGVSLLKEKRNLLVWLKLKDVFSDYENDLGNRKDDLITSQELINIESPQYSSPICCMESAMLDDQNCIVATATDDGLITVTCLNLVCSKSPRVIKLARHNDQICSLSFYTGNLKKFPLGILASASRNGLVLLWDIENEFYFADYQASVDGVGRPNSKINWFSLEFIVSAQVKTISLAVSSCDSAITLLEVPENTRSKTRLKETKDTKSKKIGNHQQQEQTIRHYALIFDMAYDSQTETLITSSLDGNHVLWNSLQTDRNAIRNHEKNVGKTIELKPCFLLPSMSNNSRTHMIRHSPIKDDLAALALGKAGIKFFKMAKSPIMRRFDMDSSCSLVARRLSKLQLSPSSVSWHPNHEYRLAAGTLEGKVIRIDITPRKASIVVAEHKPITRSWSSKAAEKNNGEEIRIDDLFDVEYQPVEHELGANQANEPTRSSPDGIYSLCWGPDPTSDDDQGKLAIYAVGSITHRLFIYHGKKDANDKLTNLLDECLDESLPEAIGEASEVAWKSSMDLMALGTTTGKVVIVSLSKQYDLSAKENIFRRIAVIQGPLGSTHIQCLAWHPTADKDDPSYYHIAVSANTSPVFVFNIKESVLVADVKKLNIEEHRSLENDQRTVSTTINDYIYKLDAHKKAITDIVWSPHDSNTLATSSFDRCCYVWSMPHASNYSATEACIVSKFIGRDRLFTLEWSLVDSDLIFTSGHDSTIWAWRPSENIVNKDSMLSIEN